MSDFEGLGDLGAIARAAALKAGCTPDELDGPPRCLAGCGAVVHRIAAHCPPCDRKRVDAEFKAAVLDAWHTVPRALRWLALDHKNLAHWARDPLAVEAARAIAARIGTRNEPTLIHFIGPTRAGKTNTGIALLREYGRAGMLAGASQSARTRARKLRFESADAIIHQATDLPLGSHLPKFDNALNASVLLLDELGRAAALDSRGLVFRIVRERYTQGRVTILTSPHETAEAFAQATKDGGLAGRAFEDATIIRVRKEAA